MVILEASNLHWLQGGDPADDQCAHGFLTLSVDGDVFVDESQGDLTLSASVLNLLRTLDHDHTDETPASNGGQLFPCCGFSVWRSSDRFPILILGCGVGVDPVIRHVDGSVQISLGTHSATLALAEWRDAVVRIAGQIEDFYNQSPPRNTIADASDAEGWSLFWSEWKSRLSAARSGPAA